MSRKERSRERRQWGCKSPAGCGAIFDSSATLASAAAVPGRVATAGFHAPDRPVTMVCPICNTFHFLTDDRRGVRPLTAAERFELYVDVPAAAAEFETRRPVAVGLAELHIVPVEG